MQYHPIPVDALLNDGVPHTIQWLANRYKIHNRRNFLDILENASAIFREGQSYGFTESNYVKEVVGEGGIIENDGEHDYSFRIYLIDLDETELTFEGIHYIYSKLASRNIFPKW